MHAEPAAMQTIVEALEPLSATQRGSVARKIRLTSDTEIAAMETILAALKGVKGAPARDRVIDWAMSAYPAVRKARTPKAKDERPKAAEPKDRTIDLRAAG